MEYVANLKKLRVIFMLKLYDKNHNFIGRILKYSDCKKESEVATGDATLSFTYLAGTFDIQNEFYVQTKDAEYVVKEMSGSRTEGQEIVAVLNLEALEQNAFQEFSVTNSTIEEAAKLFLAGTGWTVGECAITKRRNAGMRQVDAKQGILKLCTAFMCEPVFDTKAKTVSFYNEVGEDKGVYFLKGLNLRKLSKTQTSYDFYTRIIPIGADGLTIESVNGGVNYLENHQYSDKIRTMIWQDENYTDAQALMMDAKDKLDDLSKPVVEYAADIIDLAAQKPEYGILSYHLGDTVTLIDQDTGTREKQRIRKITEYEQEPEKNTCELGNTVLTFEELQDKLQAAAEIVGYTMTSDGKIHVSDILKWEEGVAGSQAVQGLNSSVTSLNGQLGALSLLVGTINANYLSVEQADLKYADIERLNAAEATVHSIQGDYAEFKSTVTNELSAQTALIEDVLAKTVTTDYLEANYAQIDLANIKDGCITTAMIGEGVVGTAQIADSSITDAKIVGLTADKITAGRLDAAEIEVVNLNAANITVGTINGQQIAPGAIDLSNLADGLSSTITNTAEDVKQALEDAGLAQSTATAAQGAASAASEAASKAQTAAEGASTAAGKAQSTADAANTAAGKAQSAADAANTAAGKAQTAADNANTAAGKAQSAAESAQSTANTAKSTADAAKTAASTAQTTADGKNTVFYQTATPATAGRKVNDVWFDTDDANCMYYFDGKAWTAKQFGGNAIAANSVTASHLVANAVTAGKIAAGAVTAGTIAANAVTAGTIAAGAVNADKLAANAVTAGKIAANAVTTATIAAGAVNADKIASNAVTADKVNAGAITTDKLAAGAVTAAKMAAKTITANSGVIADAAITSAMIASLDAGKITTGTLAAARIGAGTIDASKLSVSTLSAITANLGTVTAGIIRSATYTYSSGNYSTSGMEINLAGAGYIRAKNFAIDTSGNAYYNGTLDAAKITTGTLSADRIGAKSIKAAKIDITDLFAQDITATGTIRGAKLVGGSIQSQNYVAGISGTKYDLVSGKLESVYKFKNSIGKDETDTLIINNGVIKMTGGDLSSINPSGNILGATVEIDGYHAKFSHEFNNANTFIWWGGIQSGGDVVTGSGVSLNSLNSRIVTGTALIPTQFYGISCAENIMTINVNNGGCVFMMPINAKTIHLKVRGLTANLQYGIATFGSVLPNICATGEGRQEFATATSPGDYYFPVSGKAGLFYVAAYGNTIGVNLSLEVSEVYRL